MTSPKVILRFCSNPGFDALRFLEVNLFCFLTGNADMHLKNFSLIRTVDGEIRLSPAYDLLPTKLLLPEDAEDTALTLRGKKKKLTRKDFFAMGEVLQLTERQIQNIIARIAKRFEAVHEVIGHGFCSAEMGEKYRRLIEQRWQRLG